MPDGREHAFCVRATRGGRLFAYVEIWRTIKAVRARHASLSPERMPHDRIAATLDHAPSFGVHVIAIILLPHRVIGTTIIAHEAQHAAMAWARHRRIDLATRDGEEQLVAASEHLLKGIQAETRQLGLLVHR
jgi:hypothetical protein